MQHLQKTGGGGSFLQGMPSNSHSGTHLAVAYPPLFSITSTMPIFQVLYFHIHAWNGGYGGAPNVPTFKRSISNDPSVYPLSFQFLTHSSPPRPTSTPFQSIRYALFSPRRRVYPPRLLTSLPPYFITSFLPPPRSGKEPPVPFLDFPPVSRGGAELYFDGVPVRGEAMNEFTAWMQSNWYALGSLLSQFVFLAAGIWFARKILRTIRASQEQVGALLKMSVTGAVADRHWPSPSAER